MTTTSPQVEIKVSHALDSTQLDQIYQSVYNTTLEAIKQARKDSHIDSDILLTKKEAYTSLNVSAEYFEELLVLGLPRGRLLSERKEVYSKSEMRAWLLNKK